MPKSSCAWPVALLATGCVQRHSAEKKVTTPQPGLEVDIHNKGDRNVSRITNSNSSAIVFDHLRRVCSALLHKSHTSLVCRRQKGRRRSRSLAPAVGLRAIGEIVVNELPLILYSAPCHFYDAFGDAVRFRRVSALDEGAQLQH